MAELDRPGDPPPAAELPPEKAPASVSMACMAWWWLLILAIALIFVWWFWVLPNWDYYDGTRERPPEAPRTDPLGP